MTDVIFLHGAWHQPAHFADLIDRLAAIGMRSVAPDLLGLEPLEAKQAVEEIVFAAPRPPLLVAHSAGGITAGSVDGVASVLYLAAWIVDVGESPLELIQQDAERTGIAPPSIEMSPDPDGNLKLDPESAKAAFYADCTDDVADRAVALLRPEPLAIFTVSPASVSWREVPSHYLAAAHDLSMSASLTEMFRARCSTSQTWPTSHSAYLSQPDLVVELIRGLVVANG